MRNEKIRQLTFVAMMAAITIILANTPLGMIPINPMVSVTISHLPIILTAALIGLGPALAIGFIFGVTTMLIAWTAPKTVFDPLFINPLVSVLPRMLIAVTTFYTFKFFTKILDGKKAKIFISSLLASIIGNITNTFFVISMLVLVYHKKIEEMTSNSVWVFVAGVVSINVLIETSVIAFLGTSLISALYYAFRYMFGETDKTK